MPHQSPDDAYIGKPMRRVEDRRLLTGRGRYVADLRLPGMLHVAILRSPYAHARVKQVHAEVARALPGVVGVFTYDDLGPARQPIPLVVPHPDLKAIMWSALAPGEVNYVGEAVAAVVAVDRYVAEDALGTIDVDYEPLPVAANYEVAARPGSPAVHPPVPDNVAAVVAQSAGDVARAFQEADFVFKEELRIHRGAGMPMECRATVAQWEPATGELRLWSTTQTPHTLARNLAQMLDLPLTRVRVIAPDVGGGFGPKVLIYPEEVLLAALTMQLGQPLKYVEDRREHFVATSHERDQVHQAEIAVRADGTILGLKVRFLHDVGAYVPRGIVPPLLTASTIPGPYHVPSYDVEFRAIYTNTTPSTPMRGSGRPQGIYVMERMMDRVARELDLDPIEVRRRNLIQPDEFPYNTGLLSRDGSPRLYDSGNYPELLRQTLERVDVEAFRQEQWQARAQGRYLGLGLVLYVEDTGLGPYEGVTVRVEPSGKVVVLTGAAPQGQGHQTFLAQVAADGLGVAFEDVEVITGDSAAIPYGFGTYAARVAVTAGGSAHQAGTALREKALRMASYLLEAAPEDLRLSAGRVAVKGVPEKSVTLGELARIAIGTRVGYNLPPGVEPGFEASGYFRPDQSTYASGCHAVILEVDPASGEVQIQRYVVAHDSGRIINPLIVEGQVRGGVAHGIGNALLERLVYDDDGQLLTGTFMDYLLPTASLVPSVELAHVETLSPVNPLGVKGAGEGGTLPVPAAIAQAIDDALEPFGVRVTNMPISPEQLRELITAGRATA